MTDTEVIKYLRSKAHSLMAAADVLEGKPIALHLSQVRTRTRPRPTVDADAVLEAIRTRGYRVQNLADHFGVGADVIEAIIEDPESGLEVGGRGWIRETGEQDGQEHDLL